MDRIETKFEPCLVCEEPTEVAINIPEDEPVLCRLHYFTEDASEEWESDG